ncbi:right-handed parallel beta-helix repeat-containing protein [Candidatus Sumerlaeota bacterium]|nr:right-handed parallel beta-helix repeat-containing protein [Candidatus Sumerlaeota bacterium]
MSGRASLIHTLAAVAALTLLTLTHALAGELNPPGPPGPSMPPLEEIRWFTEPRTPILELPCVIHEPGSYVVMGNLTGDAASPGITIEVSDVTIDLNGFTLTGGPVSKEGILVPPAGPMLQGIVIRNGTLRGWGGAGISMWAARGCLVENVRVEDVWYEGITAGLHSIVRDCSVRRAPSYGIGVDDGSTVIGCTADGCLTGITADSGSTVRDCTVMNSTSSGYSIGGGCTVIGCTARSNTGDGFGLYTDTLIVDCVATDNGSAVGTARGISANPGCVIRACVASSNEGDGIFVTSRCSVIGSICDYNRNVAGDAAGIHAPFFATDCHIEDNRVSNNDIGFHIQDVDNLIIANRLTGNTASQSIVAGNAVGPWVDVSGQADISTVTGADHPWANLEY